MTLQVNSEFYTGWLDHWGDQHAAVDSRKVSAVLDEMLVMGASVNMYVSRNTSNNTTHVSNCSSDSSLLRDFETFVTLQDVFCQSTKYTLFFLRYMFEGGTNFGYWNGKKT